MNKLKISGLVLTLLLSINGLAQQRQDRSESEIVMTKAELESFLKLIAEKKLENLRTKNQADFPSTYFKDSRVDSQSQFDRLNQRIDMLMMGLYGANLAKGNITGLEHSNCQKFDSLGDAQKNIDALEERKEGSKQISQERRSYLEELLAKFRNFKRQVFFANDSDVVSKEDIAYIKDVAEVLRKNPELSVLLKGYASPKGNVEYNKALSMRRAENVLKELRNKGISENRLEASFYGEDNTTSEAGARRVDMSVVIK